MMVLATVFSCAITGILAGVVEVKCNDVARTVLDIPVASWPKIWAEPSMEISPALNAKWENGQFTPVEALFLDNREVCNDGCCSRQPNN